ncbi:hypothetical protein QYF61_015636 [Mycteria americana]|uniref:Uncharacterized protein n=1 Tax=Mycteria americana TaxID=33587 RepID=A0AAN7SIB7_MYCAM|nr:hypothetical protein QYF61_015636 [Mycteria americana]
MLRLPCLASRTELSDDLGITSVRAAVLCTVRAPRCDGKGHGEHSRFSSQGPISLPHIDNGHIITYSRTLIAYSTEISFKISTDSGQLSVRLADSKQAEDGEGQHAKKVSWFSPSRQLSTTQPLAHSPLYNFNDSSGVVPNLNEKGMKPTVLLEEIDLNHLALLLVLKQWKQSDWQHRGKPIWAAELWQDITAWVENLVVKVCHIDAHIPKSCATEEHQNKQQVDQAATVEVAQVDLDWEHKGDMGAVREGFHTRERAVISMQSLNSATFLCWDCLPLRACSYQVLGAPFGFFSPTLIVTLKGEDSSHSSSAPAWGPSHRRQSSTNFSNMSPSHRLQFFMNCSSVGPFHRVQSFRSRLLQRGSPMGSQVLPANLLQHGLLSPWVHRFCQEPAPSRASHRVTASFRHPPAPVWGPPWAAGGYLPHH